MFNFNSCFQSLGVICSNLTIFSEFKTENAGLFAKSARSLVAIFLIFIFLHKPYSNAYSLIFLANSYHVVWPLSEKW